MKKLILALALILALIVSWAAGAQACDRSTGELLSDLAIPSLQSMAMQYLSTGEFELEAWWDLHRGDTLSQIVEIVGPRLRAKVAELQVKAEAGDQTLEEYIRENYRAELWQLIEERGGSKWVIKEIGLIDPILGEWLNEWGADALAYMVDEGLISHPSLEAVAAVWPPPISDDQAEVLGLMAARKFIEIRRRHREEGLEVE